MLGKNLDNAAVGQLIGWAKEVAPPAFLGPKQIAEEEDRLDSQGWKKIKIGQDSAGNPMYCLHWKGSGNLRVAGWGYPHPDEPSGASALLGLAKRMAEAPEAVRSASWWIVLCADPIQAAENEDWITSPSLDSYLRGDWRPIYQHLSVDYEFPIDHPPFWQPRRWAPRGMRTPLPESLALAKMIDLAKPDLLCLMHGNHASGTYQFLSHRPHDHLIEAFAQSDQAFDLQAHRGEKPDPGKRWKTLRPDWAKEERLADRLNSAQREWGDLAGKKIVGCVSAAQYLESLDPEAVVITPEVGLWQPPGIGDLGPSGQSRRASIVRRQGRRGWREITYGELGMPDGTHRTVCYHIRPATGPARTINKTLPATVGMLGVEAIELRRWLLERADRIASEAKLELDTLRRAERRFINVPAGRVNDQGMLIFRTGRSYGQTASVAQASDLRYRWGMQTCLWLGHALQLYREQSETLLAEQQEELLVLAQAYLLDGLGGMTPVADQAGSQLARVLIALLAVGGR